VRPPRRCSPDVERAAQEKRTECELSVSRFVQVQLLGVCAGMDVQACVYLVMCSCVFCVWAQVSESKGCE
jgi:hypothetical protein